MGRMWHPEHLDGRDWTGPELDALAVRMKEESRIAPYDTACRAVCVDTDGNPVMLNEYGEWDYIDGEGHDMRVAWTSEDARPSVLRIWVVTRSAEGRSGTVESAWSTKSGAVSHIVRDLGATPDGTSRDGYRWARGDGTAYSVEFAVVENRG